MLVCYPTFDGISEVQYLTPDQPENSIRLFAESRVYFPLPVCLECVAGTVEPDQSDSPALLPRKARQGEEFTPKLHIQPERSLGLTARTPQSRWSAPGAELPQNPQTPSVLTTFTNFPLSPILQKLGG
jgi:hypothetical protein